MAAGTVAAEDVAARPPDGVGRRVPRRRSPAGLSRTTRRSASTWRMRSVVAVDDRGQLAAARARAPRAARAPERDGELVAGELDDPDAVGVERSPSADQSAEQDRPAARRTSDHRVAARQLAAHAGRPPSPSSDRPGPRSGVAPDDRHAMRARARPAGRATAPRHRQPPVGRPRAPTARASSASDPPDATSWLSWYWANSASASRWASSKARRLSRSSAVDPVQRGAAPRSVDRPPSAHRSRRTHETAPGSRWPTERSPSRSARPRRATRSRVQRIPRSRPRPRRARRRSGVAPSRWPLRRRRPPGASVSRIVLSPTGTGRDGPARRPPRRASPRSSAASSASASPARKPGLDAGGAVERPRRAADRRDEACTDGPQQLAGRVSAGSSASSLVAPARNPMTRLSPWSPSPRTASSRVRCALVARDDPPQRVERGPNGCGIEACAVSSTSAEAAGGRWRRTLPRASRRPPECRRRSTRPATVADPDRHPAPLQRDLLTRRCWLLDESGRSIAAIDRWPRSERRRDWWAWS